MHEDTHDDSRPVEARTDPRTALVERVADALHGLQQELDLISRAGTFDWINKRLTC